jgi:hypothetical protein
MEFVRKKKRGQDAKVRRTWLSAEKYRITWRKEVFGIAMPARYQACVLEMLPNFAGVEGEWYKSWGFVAKQRLYKTLKAAQADCEKHYRLWTKAVEASGIRALLEIFGKLPIGIPVWAKGKLNRKAYAVLVEAGRPQGSNECEDDPSTLAEASEPSSTGSPSLDTGGPVPNAGEKDGVTRSLTTESTTSTSDALPVTEAEKEPKKSARKRTAGRSPSSKRKGVSTKGSSNRAKKPSKGSRKNKSKPSAN